MQYPAANVRKAAVTNVSRLCCSFHDCLVQSGATDLSGIMLPWDTHYSAVSHQSLHLDLQQLVEPAVVALMDKIRQDRDRGVVMASLEAITDLLKQVKLAALSGDGSLDAIVMGTRHVFELKVCDA